MIDPLKIEGWMSEDELIWLAKHAQESDSILEIGIWKARSTYTLCKYAKGTVVAIDNWRGAVGQEKDYPDCAGAEQSARLTLKEFTDSGKLRIVKGFSMEVLYKIPETFDFIFIDGSHDYESVKLDIALSRLHLRPGGLMSGHDFNYVGVHQAVTEFFGEAWYRGFGSIWFWRDLTWTKRQTT